MIIFIFNVDMIPYHKFSSAFLREYSCFGIGFVKMQKFFFEKMARTKSNEEKNDGFTSPPLFPKTPSNIIDDGRDYYKIHLAIIFRPEKKT